MEGGRRTAHQEKVSVRRDVRGGAGRSFEAACLENSVDQGLGETLNKTTGGFERASKSKVPLKSPEVRPSSRRRASRAFKGTSRFPRPPTLRAIVASSLATDVGALLFWLYWPLELPSLPRGNFEGPKPRSGLIRTFGFRRRNRPPYLPEGGSRGIVKMRHKICGEN